MVTDALKYTDRYQWSLMATNVTNGRFGCRSRRKTSKRTRLLLASHAAIRSYFLSVHLPQDILHVLRSSFGSQGIHWSPPMAMNGHQRTLVTTGTDRYHILQWLGGHRSPLVPIGTNGHQCWSPMQDVRTHAL